MYTFNATIRLVQLDQSTGLCQKTTLNIVDLAGAERPSSTGSDHESAISAIMDYFRGKEPTVGGQGTIVNFELSALRSAVVMATSRHRQGKPVKPPSQCSTAFVDYTMGCFNGKALLSMLVTLSPAPSCGWETWFSCQYGTDLSKLHAPVSPQKPRPIQKVAREAKTAAEKCLKALNSTPVTGPAAKYRKRRIIMARHTERESALYAQLIQSAESGS